LLHYRGEIEKTSAESVDLCDNETVGTVLAKLDKSTLDTRPIETRCRVPGVLNDAQKIEATVTARFLDRAALGREAES
jgi:hypothetical protein